MHGNITPIKPDNPEPVVRRRTITLTNRAPIVIVEDDWPMIAQGISCHKQEGAPIGWEISIRVRHQRAKYNAQFLIHAKYLTFDDDYEPDNDDDKHNQMVRVGRIITEREAAMNLWKHILAVGEELRERILDEHKRKFVTHAVDRCFANLTPRKEC
jgi:hypothetical protein